MREIVSRTLMFAGLVVTGMALLFGFLGAGRDLTRRLGGPERAELTFLAVGAAVFLAGRAIAGRR